jgi:hypothetical protein
LVLIKNCKENGAGRSLSSREQFIVFNEELQGKWGREDPELSGAISLLLLLRNYMGEECRIRSSRGSKPYVLTAPIHFFNETSTKPTIFNKHTIKL